jgi:hypothetical protein
MIWQVKHLKDTLLILMGNDLAGLIEWARSSMLGVDPIVGDRREDDDSALSGECRRSNRTRVRVSCDLARGEGPGAKLI